MMGSLKMDSLIITTNKAGSPTGFPMGLRTLFKHVVQKVINDFAVTVFVNQITDSVICIRKGVPLYIVGAGILDFLAHFTGDKAVCFSVKDQNMDFAVLNSFQGIRFLQIKAAEDFGTNGNKGIAQGRGDPHFCTDLLNNFFGSGIGTVSNDPFYIVRQIQG